MYIPECSRIVAEIVQNVVEAEVGVIRLRLFKKVWVVGLTGVEV